MCGEKDKAAEKAQHLRGSPPRVRGKDTLGQIVHTGVGITPACAGKSLWSPLLLILAEDHPRVCGEKDLELYRIMTTKDHPRMCGEKLETFFKDNWPKGSPPRVRGKVINCIKLLRHCRITPARAGKSCPPQAPTFTRQDHPRVCGEKPFSQLDSTVPPGSPPRVRGKVLREVVHHAAERITPAYAGKRNQHHRD